MDKYLDEKGGEHYITDCLGADGQGELFRTKNETVLLWMAKGLWESAEVTKRIKLMPLDNDCRVLLPAVFLKAPEAGYVMKVPKEYTTLNELIEAQGDKKAHYLKTGGLKRRLLILASLAKILMRLHGIPVMYGGFSNLRVLIPKSLRNSEVYLMYASGMSSFMNLTPTDTGDPYMAPETKKGLPAGIRSDSFAFAQLAYQVLTMSNELPEMLPDTIKQFLLHVLDNPQDVEGRPKMAEYYHLFADTADLLLTCEQCGMAYAYETNECPDCHSKRPKFIKADISDQISNTTIRQGTKIFEYRADVQSFYDYHTGYILAEHRQPQKTIDLALNRTKDKKLRIIFRNYLESQIKVNGSPLATNKGIAVGLPCDTIKIEIPLHTHSARLIDLTIV